MGKFVKQTFLFIQIEKWHFFTGYTPADIGICFSCQRIHIYNRLSLVRSDHDLFIIGLLEQNHMKKLNLIINRIRMDMVKRGEMMSVEDVTEILPIDLLQQPNDAVSITNGG